MLELAPIELKEEYRKKWNIHSRYRDFVHICKDGVKLNDNLYRVGGFGVDLKKDYFLLLKYEEPKDVKSNGFYLDDNWVIIDKNGIEKIQFKKYESPYLTGGIVYSLDNKYYNIETGNFIAEGHSRLLSKSRNYLFLDNNYTLNKPDSELGILKVDLRTGETELFN